MKSIFTILTTTVLMSASIAKAGQEIHASEYYSEMIIDQIIADISSHISHPLNMEWSELEFKLPGGPGKSVLVKPKVGTNTVEFMNLMVGNKSIKCEVPGEIGNARKSRDGYFAYDLFGQAQVKSASNGITIFKISGLDQDKTMICTHRTIDKAGNPIALGQETSLTSAELRKYFETLPYDMSDFRECGKDDAKVLVFEGHVDKKAIVRKTTQPSYSCKAVYQDTEAGLAVKLSAKNLKEISKFKDEMYYQADKRLYKRPLTVTENIQDMFESVKRTLRNSDSQN